jgi:YD repeat-containing protein
VVELVLGTGARIRFDLTNPGAAFGDKVFEHTATPTAWQKATVRYVGGSAPHWLLTRTDGMQYEFFGHAGSYLLAIRDPRGNRLTIERVFTSGGLGEWGTVSRWPVRITSPNGRIVEFTTDTTTTGEELITQATDLTTGRTVSYSYDSSKRLISVTDAGGGVTEYTYSGTTQRIATIKDPRNITWLTNTYDSNGRVTQQTFPDSTTWQYAYTVNGSNQVTQADVTDPRGNVERIAFNAGGQPTSITRAYGTSLAQTTTYTRNATTNLPTRITDALSRNTDFTYDSKGNVLTVTRLAGTSNAVTTTYTYTSAFSQVASITDPLSHATSFAYDSAGNLTSVTNALSQATTFTHDLQGKVLSATDPLSQTTSFGYLNGDLQTVTTPLSQTTTRFIDDGNGNLLSLTDAPQQHDELHVLQHGPSGDPDRPADERRELQLRQQRQPDQPHRPEEPGDEPDLRRPGPPDPGELPGRGHGELHLGRGEPGHPDRGLGVGDDHVDLGRPGPADAGGDPPVSTGTQISPDAGSEKSPPRVHSVASAGRTRPALSLSLSR